MGISDSLAHIVVYSMSLGDPMFMCLPHYTRHPVLLRAAILVHTAVASQYVSGFTTFGRLTTAMLCNEA
jgi:hypothetical protein